MSRASSRGVTIPSLIPSKLLTPDFVAEILGVTTHTLAVWRCANRYPLAYVKIGGRVRYRPADVDAFIAEQTHLSDGAPSNAAARRAGGAPSDRRSARHG